MNATVSWDSVKQCSYLSEVSNARHRLGRDVGGKTGYIIRVYSHSFYVQIRQSRLTKRGTLERRPCNDIHNIVRASKPCTVTTIGNPYSPTN